MNLSVEDLMNHAVVITVDDRRLEAFQKRWTSYGLPMPKTFHGFHLQPRRYEEIKTTISDLAANISFSHAAVVKLAQTLDWPYVFVLEDDALPCRGILNRLQDALTDIPDETVLLKLGWVGHQNRAVPDIASPKFVHVKSTGGHAYVVFNRHYKEYDRVFSTVSPVADDHLMNSNVKIIAYNRSLFAQKNPCASYKQVHESGMPHSINLMKAQLGGGDFDW